MHGYGKSCNLRNLAGPHTSGYGSLFYNPLHHYGIKVQVYYKKGDAKEMSIAMFCITRHGSTAIHVNTSDSPENVQAFTMQGMHLDNNNYDWEVLDTHIWLAVCSVIHCTITGAQE